MCKPGLAELGCVYGHMYTVRVSTETPTSVPITYEPVPCVPIAQGARLWQVACWAACT